MRSLFRTVMAAAALAGAAFFASGPAQAQVGFGYSWSGPDGAIGFSYDSGGYCDAFGCPPGYWDMPVYYGPVFYRGVWYRGPVYYRDWAGTRWFWIRGGWRRDEWRGRRPYWARSFHIGPALGYGYYERDRRFRIRDEWRRKDRDHDRWDNRRDRDERRDWDRRDNDRRGEWNRNRRDNDRRDWNRDDNNRDSGRNDNRRGGKARHGGNRDNSRNDNRRGAAAATRADPNARSLREVLGDGVTETNTRGQGGNRKSGYPRARTQN